MELIILCIKHIMKRKGKTQKELAKACGVSEVQFSKWMNGKAEMGFNRFVLICEYVNEKPSLILSDNGL